MPHSLRFCPGRFLSRCSVILFAWCLCVCTVDAQTADSVELAVGDEAPSFSATTDADEQLESNTLRGEKIVVLYFYPADMTGGCTKQACNYRDSMEQFAAKDVVVLGVSGDSAENHRHFKEAHNLNFALLADTEGELAKAFGVKTGGGFTNRAVINGEEFSFPRSVTTSRWTFVIDRDWKIAYKNASVSAAADTAEVMKLVESLQTAAVE